MRSIPLVFRARDAEDFAIPFAGGDYPARELPLSALLGGIDVGDFVRYGDEVEEEQERVPTRLNEVAALADELPEDVHSPSLEALLNRTDAMMPRATISPDPLAVADTIVGKRRICKVR